ncbi:MAG: outer membrane beta-barrel protein [Bacteroidales bacterium]
MSKYVLIYLLGLILAMPVLSQTDSLGGFTIGVNYGGAIPTEMDTSAFGNGVPGVVAGLEYRIPLSHSISLQPALLYAFKQFHYGTIQKNDTVVSVDITNDGNYVNIPTYYTAHIEGKSRIHSLDIRIPLHWKMNAWSSMQVGIYGSWLMAGKDESTATVQIGEGSIIDDVVETSNAFEEINPFETGIILGGSFYVNSNLLITVEGSRALTPYYRDQYYAELNQGKEIKLYQTYGMIRVSYFY